MDPSKTNPQEYLRQALDAEIKSLEESTQESIRSLTTLKYRRNALVPVRVLPPEVIITIFSFLRLPGSSPDPHLAWLGVAHVCHQWREIALNLPLFWTHIDFTNLTSAGAAEILTRAKKAPLHLEATVPDDRWESWDDRRFREFGKELQNCVSHISHLTIRANSANIRKTLEKLVSPAPKLEYLSLSHPTSPWPRKLVTNTLFDGTAPRLSCLELRNYSISWQSPLLKGLKSLEMRQPCLRAKPSLDVWMDTLKGMSQLRRLVLHSACPDGPRSPFDVVRTVTLPFLTHLDIAECPWDCARALAHLVLPALTFLRLAVGRYLFSDGNNAEIVLPYIAQHAHGLQDTQPLQSMFIRCDTTHAEVLAWSVPDVDMDIDMEDPATSESLAAATPSARVVLSFQSIGLFGVRRTLDAAMAALPLDNLVSLTADDDTRLSEQRWLHHAQRWPLLQSVRLAPHAAREFREMLLLQDGNGGVERPLLPSLTKLVLGYTALSERRTLRLCDALRRRVERGFPLETLDLRTTIGNSHAVGLLREFGVDVWGPSEARDLPHLICDSETRGQFVHDASPDSEDEYDYLDYDEDEMLVLTVEVPEQVEDYSELS